eukprot:m.330455 g.330455  ORF g.330455 m.330455 type:complete len:430 (-) comp20461_c0_seq2:185-1474(-)
MDPPDLMKPLGLRAVLFGAKSNVLLLALPVLWMAEAMQADPGLRFWISLVCLVPLAERLSFVTEQMALHTNSTIGGLLNATFGNVTELMVCIFALREGLIRVVQLSLLGSIISNLLLVLGFSFFVGGIRYKEQKFKEVIGNINSGLLMLSATALLLPTLLKLTGADTDDSDDLQSSRAVSLILLINYGLFLLFQLKTHTSLFEDDDDDDAEPIVLGPKVAAFWLTIITVIVSMTSDILVSTIRETASEFGISSGFMCAVLIPMAGNAAEHGAAVIFAWKNQMDLALGIALGSAIQVALFVLPVCVLLGWLEHKSMSLYFQSFDCVVLLLTVILTVFVLFSGGGKSNWLMGAILISAYIVIAIGFYDHKTEDLSLDHFAIQRINEQVKVNDTQKAIEDAIHSHIDSLANASADTANMDSPFSDLDDDGTH